MAVGEQVVRANASRGAGAGIQFGASVVLFTLAGVWADRHFDTLPLFLLIGLGLGFGGGLYHLVRTLGRREEPAEQGADTSASHSGAERKR